MRAPIIPAKSALVATAIPTGDSVGFASISAIIVAPDSLCTDQDIDSGDGRHCPSPSLNSSSWAGFPTVRRPRQPRGLRSRLGLVRCPSATSRLIGEPLAFDAQQREISPHLIINAELDPVGIAEIELAQIPMQMSL